MTDFDFSTLPEGVCFQVWRIEKFKCVPWSDIGAFHVGDAYLVLDAHKVGTSERIARDIYYWLGSECTRDESGTAAHKAVELDDRFGGEPVQWRETEGNESDKFVHLFDSYGGLRYLAGGIDSGFRSIDDEVDPILYHVKGKRNPVVKQVPCAGTSLNQGDVFILSTPGRFFLWIGKKANHMEKLKGNQALDVLRSKKPRWDTVRLDDGDTTPEFWAALGGETPIASAEEGGGDAEAEMADVRRIYKFENDRFTLVAEAAAAKKDLLQGPNMFVISRKDEIIIWLGDALDASVKRQVTDVAERFITEFGLPANSRMKTEREGIDSEDLDMIFQ